MRVQMICSQYPPVYGGAGQQAALLGSKLRERGWTVDMVTLDQDGVGSESGSSGRTVRVLRGVQPSTRANRVRTTVALAMASALRILRTRPDVVHIHGIYWWSIPPAIAGRVVGARVILKSTRDGEDDVETVLHRRAVGLPIGWIYGLSIHLASTIVVLNTASATKSSRNGLGAKTALVPNGVDGELFSATRDQRNEARLRLGIDHDQKVFLFVGYLVPHKGVPELLEAWDSMDSTFRDRASLWLAGPWKGFYRELEPGLGQRLAEIELDSSRIELLGQLSQVELSDRYRAADYFVFPSHAEGMPNSLLEAAVAGCDLIATDIPGINDLLAPGEATLVAPGDAKGLQTVIENGIDGSLRAHVVNAERLLIDAVADRYELLYDGTDALAWTE